MRRKIFAYALLGLGLPLHTLADAPKVAVDIAPLHSLVSQVMQGVGEPDLIISAEASPHHYNLKPSQANALSNADIVFWMGEELTPWLDKTLNNVAESARKVAVLDLPATTTYPFREGATFEQHAHDEHEGHDEHAGHEKHEAHADEHHHADEHGHEHEHEEHHAHEPGLIDRFLSLFSGDDHDHHEDETHDHADSHHDADAHKDEHDGHHHDGIDPHAWLDPENAKQWVSEIAARLSELDADNAATYQSNAQQAVAELDQLITNTRQSISAMGDIKFIVFHDAYQYFEQRFGITAAGSISLSDAEAPSPARVAEIRDTVKKLGVTCIFAEPQYDEGLVRNVFEDSTVTAIGVMDPLGAALTPGPSHYSALIQGMTASLQQCQ